MFSVKGGERIADRIKKEHIVNLKVDDFCVFLEKF